MSAEVRDLLVRELSIREEDVHILPAPLGLSGLMGLTDLTKAVRQVAKSVLVQGAP